MIQEFVDKIYAAAQSEQKRSGVLASVTIAQAILESAAGRHAPGNNLFGIKWSEGCGRESQLLDTHEYINGHKLPVKAKFRKYPSFNESITDHTNLLMKNRYKPVRSAKTYQEQCIQLQKCGYATDPKYPEKLTNIIEKYSLYKFDVIQVANPVISQKSTIPKLPRILKKGCKGKDVKLLQQYLNKAMRTKIAEDGDFGKRTRGLVMAFQKKHKLMMDGVVGPKTWGVLHLKG